MDVPPRPLVAAVISSAPESALLPLLDRLGRLPALRIAAVVRPAALPARNPREGAGRKMITYWCDVCFIRAYAPGPCVCCPRETTLELRNPDEIR